MGIDEYILSYQIYHIGLSFRVYLKIGKLENAVYSYLFRLDSFEYDFF